MAWERVDELLNVESPQTGELNCLQRKGSWREEARGEVGGGSGAAREVVFNPRRTNLRPDIPFTFSPLPPSLRTTGSLNSTIGDVYIINT